MSGPLAPAEVMSTRAQVYLVWVFGQNLGFGVVCLVFPSFVQAPAFSILTSLLVLPMWGVAFVLVAAIPVIAAIQRSRELARTALLASAVASGTWATGLLLAAPVGRLSGLFLVIALVSLTAKDLVMLAQPLRTPFERTPNLNGR